VHGSSYDRPRPVLADPQAPPRYFRSLRLSDRRRARQPNATDGLDGCWRAADPGWRLRAPVAGGSLCVLGRAALVRRRSDAGPGLPKAWPQQPPGRALARRRRTNQRTLRNLSRPQRPGPRFRWGRGARPDRRVPRLL